MKSLKEEGGGGAGGFYSGHDKLFLVLQNYLFGTLLPCLSIRPRVAFDISKYVVIVCYSSRV
jgi:hypothetical protein